MREAIEQYLLECQVSLSPQTLAWYQHKLAALEEWLGERDLTTPTANQFLAYLQTHPSGKTGKMLSTYTTHGYAQVIRGFLNWCDRNGYGSHRPPAMPRVKQKIIETFSEQQIKALLSACAQEETPTLAARDRAILFTLLDTGVRASELCHLRLAGLHLAENYLKVLGKGNREREVAFGQHTKTELTRYLRRYRQGRAETVFVGKKYQPLTLSGLDQMLTRLAEWSGITGVRCSAHTFRHTMAVRFLLAGGDVYTLSRMLGHASVSTTEMYVRSAKDQQLRRTMVSVADVWSLR